MSSRDGHRFSSTSGFHRAREATGNEGVLPPASGIWNDTALPVTRARLQPQTLGSPVSLSALWAFAVISSPALTKRAASLRQSTQRACRRQRETPFFATPVALREEL